MRTAKWLALAIPVVAVAGLALFVFARTPALSTGSPEARAEFALASEAFSKFYHDEARKHLEKALALDPDFALAKARLSSLILAADPERSGRLLGEASSVDLESLSPMERFRIRRTVALRDGQHEVAAALLEEYVAAYPNDPIGLSHKANALFDGGDLEAAAQAYKRVLEVDPNRVLAYNSLGYLAMRQGRFEEAEEYFKSYRFIAPDQANPHDSLGELYLLVGRHEEARASFEKAVEVRPEFCASHGHLVMQSLLERDYEWGQEILGNAADSCSQDDNYIKTQECILKFGELEDSQAWSDMADLASSGCLHETADMYFVTLATFSHRAACELGDNERALAIEDFFQHKHKDKTTATEPRPNPVNLHLQGVRLALQANLAEAEERLRAADLGLSYNTAPFGQLKLTNRLVLAEVLRARNSDLEAHQLLDQVRRVNSRLVAEFEEQGLAILGLRSRTR